MVSTPVTLAVPCRDAGLHLRPLIESLLTQTHDDCRLLLVDDCSADGSARLAREVAGDRIEIHTNDHPLGIGGNWNRCAELVTTPFFCLAHQDDVYDPDFVSRMLQALFEHPDAGMAHCRAKAIDGDGSQYRSPAERYKHHFWRDTHSDNRAEHYLKLWCGNYVCCPSAVYRTDAFRSTGGFRTDLRFALDWEYWFRLLRGGFGIVDVNSTLLSYRRHETAATRAATAGDWRFAEELRVLHEARDLGLQAGLLPSSADASPALRNNLLHEALTDLQAGHTDAVARKLEFVREHAPELWADRYVRTFRALSRLGLPGRALLGLGRTMAVRFGLGSGGHNVGSRHGE